MTDRDWRNWLADILGINPDNRDELLSLLQNLQKDRHLFSAREVMMIEGVLRMQEWKIRDIMIPRSDIIAISEDSDYADIVKVVCEWQHSRYPVFDKENESVLGILLAKDLLKFTDRTNDFRVTDVMRPPVFESTYKSLDVLLEDFRTHRNHMVIVVDEHALPVGILTIEDLLERIVGEIEDESDEDEDKPAIELPDGEGFVVKGTISIEEFNQQFKTNIPNEAADSIAGWLCAEMGRMPLQGETYCIHDLTFKVMKSDERRIYNLIICRQESNVE